MLSVYLIVYRMLDCGELCKMAMRGGLGASFDHKDDTRAWLFTGRGGGGDGGGDGTGRGGRARRNASDSAALSLLCRVLLHHVACYRTM